MKIRGATFDDCDDIFKWRNDPRSVVMFENNSMVTESEHATWFANSLINPFRKLYVGVFLEGKIGVVRFDLNSDQSSAEVSINLNPIFRGKGHGFALLSRSIEVYTREFHRTLLAKIKKENYASRVIFTKCGFNVLREDDVFYYLSRI